MQIRRTAATLASVAALGIGGVALAAPASAEPVVTGGLVNITVVDVLNNVDVNVQVPIGVAANVCGVNAAVLAALPPASGPVDCTAATTQDLPVRFRP
jgi:hypothetical protein